jgi:hypothetical protein
MARHASIKFLALSLLMSIFLGACETTPDTYSSVAPGENLNGIKTYGFLEQTSTDRPGYESLETNFLKVAVAQHLDRRGLTYDPANPDVVMNFYIRAEEKIRTRQTPTAGGYYGYRSGSYDGFGGGYETRVEQYTVGTLTIDMIDLKKRKLLWEGTVTGRLTKKDVQDMETTIDTAVADIFVNFPINRPTH